MPDADADPAELYRQAVAARDVNIGTTTDSVDDTARLMLVTAYAGSRMVHVYATGPGLDLTGTEVGNRIQTAGFGEDNVANVFVTLEAVGRFYLAGTAAGPNAVEGDGLDGLDLVLGTRRRPCRFSPTKTRALQE